MKWWKKGRYDIIWVVANDHEELVSPIIIEIQFLIFSP
jgi:hypothetical protein